MLPFQKEGNTKPTAYLGSSLGSSLHIYDEADLTLIVTDPDGDDIHATVTMYGKPHEDCNWPQCNSKTIHVTADANPDGESRAELTFSNWWRLPGRYIVRVTVTDYRGGFEVLDVPFLLYKFGDTNKTAP